MEKSVEIDEKYMNSKNIIKENLSINITDRKTQFEDNNNNTKSKKITIIIQKVKKLKYNIKILK